MAMLLASCDSNKTISPPYSSLVALSGPPTVHVRLMSRSVSNAQVGCTGAFQLIVDGKVKYSQGAQRNNSTFSISRSDNTWTLGRDNFHGSVLIVQPTPSAGEQPQGRILLKKPGQSNPTAYRGRFKLIPAGPAKFTVVNEVDLESYLAGVLPGEMYPSWPGDALRAQAVAARTHAWFTALKAKQTGRSYHVNDDTSNQVYQGLSGETASTTRAVKDTWGVVLSVEISGRNEMFLAQYSSCCGGRINGAEAIRSGIPDITPLKGGQTCNDCDQRGNSNFRWSAVKIPKDRVFQALKRTYPSIAILGGIRKIKVRSRSDYGRMLWLDLTGLNGKRETVRAEDLRIALNNNIPDSAGLKLKSMNCTIVDRINYFEFRDGRGWGHGVGMCQWGAKGKAQSGSTWRKILGYYYPGAILHKAY